MARSIKIINGSYIAQTSTYFDNASTGYTVPSGKIARIGFNVSSIGGRSASSNSARASMGGFYAGAAGDSSTGATTNRLLFGYNTGTRSGESYTFGTCTVTYDPNHGHMWSVDTTNQAKHPRLYIGDNMREKYVTRGGTDWGENNFTSANSNASSSRWGTFHWNSFSNATFTNQMHHFVPMGSYTHSGVSNSRGQHQGPVHANAGETIYIWDHAGYEFTTWNKHAFSKVQYSLFIIEEDE